MSATEDDRNIRKTDMAEKLPTPMFVYVLTTFATLGGFLFGCDTGIVSGSVLLIRPYFYLDTVWTEVIVSGTIASAALFSLLGGYLMDLIGRQRTLLVGSMMFATGAIVMASATCKEVLLVGRIIVGVAVGFGSVAVPVYVAEVAPPCTRGALLCWNQLFITGGIFVASVVAGIFSWLTRSGWRYMLGLGVVPAVIQFAGFIFLPESPRWLMNKGYEIKARDVLVRIRGTSNVEEEVSSIRDSILESKKCVLPDRGSILVKACSTAHVFRALLVGCTLQFFQQGCGINTVIYYSATVMKMAGFPVTWAIWLAVAPTSVNFLATLIGVFLIDRWGRKKLITVSLVGVFVALVILAVGFQLSAVYTPPINVFETDGNRTSQGACSTLNRNCAQCTTNTNCGFCYDVKNNGSCLPADLETSSRSLVGRCNSSNQSGSQFKFTYGYCPNNFTWMPVVGMVIYVLFFAPGLGPVPWAVNSEIYPLWARGMCMSVAGTTNWLVNLVVSLTFLTLTETITKYGTFWLFAGISVLGILFVLVFMPETKNKNLEEVEQLFMSPETRLERLHLLQAQLHNNK